MQKYKILYVDDNHNNLELFADEFADKFKVRTSNDPTQAMADIRKNKPDLVVLDLHMPFISGLELFQKMRESKDLCKIPVMFYSIDDSDDTISRALQLGPEDFLTRNMSTREIEARISNRLSKVKKQKPNIIKFGNVDMDTRSLSTRIDGGNIALTNTEFKILYFLLFNQERNVSKEELMAFVWDSTHVLSRTINTHMTNLRNKIKGANFTIRINRNNQIRLLRDF